VESSKTQTMGRKSAQTLRFCPKYALQAEALLSALLHQTGANPIMVQ
jgi:hypothetical protein